ncbi:MAG: VanZ family protein [candidate division KSB1 bacterium]|nr:VanZ family protein [candidate division KSB1 bacterium]MDZ7276450.1 VanZ family protein [candidate division KSB1 bacterium]MDZ7288119.1 VanZ family protein [candidate division KSB1 bacterium]MDZ7300220.1 VanZ family protein [candidate division KSB1 bacterium]MDZ7351220.1 VanZ family protein [candidate division KSB1 bacterium]
MVALMVCYLTAVPFHLDVSRPGVARRWARAELVPFHNAQGRRMSGTDTLGNLLLFLPLGFCWHGWRMASTRRPRLAATVLACALVSFTIESTQLLLSDRFTSVNDVMNNTYGAALGAALALRFYAPFAASLQSAWRYLRRRPGVLAGLALGLSFMLWRLAPFNFTPRLDNVWNNGLHWLHSVRHLARLQETWRTLDLREYWPLAGAENLLFGIVLGGMLHWCVCWYWPANPRSKWAIALITAGLLLLLNSFALLAKTNPPDLLPDLAFVLGMLLGSRIFRTAPPHTTAAVHRLRWWYVIFFLIVLGRPDYSEPALTHNGTTTGLLTELVASVHPHHLFRPDAQPLRLFIKLLLTSFPIAFWLSRQARERWKISLARRLVNGVLLGAALGLGLQLLRHLVMGGHAGLPAVIALMAGAAVGILLENWWERETSRRPAAATKDSCPAPGTP